MEIHVAPLEGNVAPQHPLRISKYLKMTTILWGSQLAIHLVGISLGLPTVPIAETPIMSLLTIYIPVFILAVPLLLFLTRNRAPVNWSIIYAVDVTKAKSEALAIGGYLILTQLLLGFWGSGLHFPGPDVYESGSHDLLDVTTWAGLYMLIYVVIPAVWLRRTSPEFSWGGLVSSVKWRENALMIFAYWAVDFFGVMGYSDFGGMNWEEYAVAVPLGIVVNTLGAGLPVVVVMHVLLIPRLAVLCPTRGEYKDKITFAADRMTTIALGGVCYAIFSLFDQGVDYSSGGGAAVMSASYIFMTQILIGSCKASFTVVTGNPLIHFICLHVLSARVPLDTRMYGEVFGVVK
jgi:hypothetical protein